MSSNHSALPTSSKLSRGIKGSIQRIFVGEKNNNQVVVYKYNITNQEWYKEYTISSPDSSILKFGFSLAGTDDASILAVGAPGTTEGRVYIYEKDNTGSGWSQRGTTITHPMLNFSGTGSDGFGHSVALSQHDGNILVIGAPFYNEQTPAFATSIDYPVCEGRAFIFKYVGGTSGWAGSAYSFLGTKSSPSGFLNTSFPASWRDFYFGWSLDISDIGNMIIIGSPSIRKLDDIAKNHQETGDLFFDTSVYDEYYNAVEVSDLETNWGHTGNAHVYHNHTVLSGGTTWTSNVNVTEVIDVTSIGGITVDTQPEKIRPFEAVGTSVGINRAGNRIFATAPYSYGTSNASPQIFSGRIYTLEWNTVTGTWDEMGRINKHINGGINFRLLGFSAEFDGSGNRIVAGAPEWVSINRKLRGQVETFDWNGEAWVSYPTSSVGVDVITDETFYFYQNMRFGDSVSVDGEGEMIAIGMGGNNLYYSGSSTNLPRPSQLSVYGITYIGGATTTVAGSDSHILTGSSNIWVYNNPQSMIVSGNMTVSGCMQTSGIAIGSNDDTDTSRKTIFFGGTKADNAYDYTVIENRVYESAEKSELLIFKGDNNADFNGGGIYGPDRIRLKSGQICFDLNTGYERDGEDIRFTMNKNKLQGGKFGVNTDSPTEAVDVYGKIKSSQGFIGRGEELIGLDLHDSLIRVNNNTGIAGSSYNDLTLGEMSMVSSSTTYPTVNLTSNTNQGYTVLSSFDVTNAWKAFDATSTGFSYSWQLDTGNADGSQGTPLYTRFGPEIGYYFGSTERFPGYPGEWIEIQMASSVPKLLLTEVLINVPGSGSYPLNLHVFGSDNGTDYYHIHTEIKASSYTASSNTDVSAFTRTPSVNDKPYNKFVLICSRVKVPFDGIYWSNVRLKGSTLSAFNQKLKLDKTGKIGVGTTNPNAACHVIGDINVEGEFKQNNSTLIGLGSSSSAGAPLQVLASTSNTSPTNNGIFLSQTGASGTNHAIMAMKVNGTNSGDPFVSWDTDVTGWSMGIDNSDDDKLKIANSKDAVSTNTEMTIDTNGKVGIGTSSPAYLLDVNGDINIAGGSSLRIGGVAQSFGGGGGGSSVESDASYFYVIVDNSKFGIDGTQQPTLTLYRGVTYRFDQSSNTNGSHPFRISTTAEGGNAPGTTYNGSNGSSGSYRQYIVPDNAPNTMYYNCANHTGMGGTINIVSGITNTSGLVASNVFMQNNVGIGTNSPKAQLHVKREGSSGESNVYIQSYSDSTGDRAALFLGTPHQNSTSAQPKCAIIADAVDWSRADLHFCVETTANNGSAYRASTSNSRMMIDGTSGKVGIGTSSPAYTLDVNGDINIAGGSSLRIGGVAQSFGGGSGAWTTSGSDVYRSSGNVGIGTTSPNAELDVNGHIHCNSIQTGTSRYEQHLVKSNLIRLRFTSGASTPTTQSAMDTYFESLSSGTKSLSRPRLAANNSFNTFADTFEGYLKVTTAGTHYFGLNSDDASDMYINGIQVAYWYGGHAHNGTTTTPGGTTGNIYLKTGYHKIFVRFQENGGGEALYSLWKEPGDSSWSEIPADNCFYDHIRYH